MVICPNCGHEGKLTSYIDGCDACGAKFLVSDFETKVSGFSLEEDARQKSISNFMKAGAVVGITAISLAGLAILLLALGRNGYNAVKAAAAMMLGIGLAPVFFRSLFYMLIIFIVMLIVMETCRKPRIQDESKVKAAIPEFSTGNFLQNLGYGGGTVSECGGLLHLRCAFSGGGDMGRVLQNQRGSEDPIDTGYRKEDPEPL